MRRSFVVVAMLGTLFASACGDGGDDPSAEPDREGSEAQTAGTTAEEPTDSEDAIRAYFEGFAEYTVESMDEMIENSGEGSIAGAYAVHQQAITQAQRDAGQSPPLGSYDVTFSDDAARLCGPAPDGGRLCSEYADFEADPATGKLTDFTVDGVALDDRLILGNGQSAQALGATVVLVSAYQSVQSDALFVVFDITAGDRPVIPAVYSATYVGADGRQSQAGQSVVPSSDLQAGATITGGAAFSGAALGGRVSFPMNTTDFLEQVPVEFTLA